MPFGEMLIKTSAFSIFFWGIVQESASVILAQ